MKIRRDQLALILGLSLPLAITAMTAPPFVAQPTAQAANRMLGPNFPGLVDSNGNGAPNEGADERIIPTFSGNTLTVNTRWDCSRADTDNQFTLDTPDAQGRYTRMTHLSGFLTHTITPGGTVDSQGIPTSVNFAWSAFFGSNTNGRGYLQDNNNDGAYESGLGVGTSPSGQQRNVTVNWTYTDVTGDGNPDYISIPWSQASAVGVVFNDGCGDPDPQVFAPLADSDGDGRPDAIVLDLDGNGVADPQFFRSPRLVAPTPTPTMNVWGLGVLFLLLASLGYWSLKQRISVS